MLSRRNRIPTEEFPGVTRGKMFQNDLFRVVLKYDTALKQPKCAVIVPNKISKKAVSRNRIRRQVYAVLEESLTSLPVAHISVFPKKALMTHEEIVRSLGGLLSPQYYAKNT